MTDYEILPTNRELAARAAELIYDAAREAIAERGRFTIALTGGSSPRLAYELLAHAAPEQMDWAKVFVFLGDDRFVPYSSKDSNYEMCRELLLNHVPIPPEQVFPIHTDTATKEEAAELYAETLAQVFSTPQSGPPAFDMILLGMGDDGHTASLFPGTTGLRETAPVAAAYIEKLAAYRITFTPGTLKNSALVMLLVAGKDKADTLAAVLEGPSEPDKFPVQGITATDGETLWLLDQAAVAKLKGHG